MVTAQDPVHGEAGVDLDLIAHGSGVEQVFRVGPGAEAGAIRVRIEGAESLTVDESGALMIHGSDAKASLSPPVAWQEANGKRHPVQVAYALSDNGYGFVVGDWNAHGQVPGCTTTDALPVLGRDVTSLALLDASVRTAEPGNFYGEPDPENGHPPTLDGETPQPGLLNVEFRGDSALSSESHGREPQPLPPVPLDSPRDEGRPGGAPPGEEAPGRGAAPAGRGRRGGQALRFRRAPAGAGPDPS